MLTERCGSVSAAAAGGRASWSRSEPAYVRGPVTAGKGQGGLPTGVGALLDPDGSLLTRGFDPFDRPDGSRTRGWTRTPATVERGPRRGR